MSPRAWPAVTRHVPEVRGSDQTSLIVVGDDEDKIHSLTFVPWDDWAMGLPHPACPMIPFFPLALFCGSSTLAPPLASLWLSTLRAHYRCASSSLARAVFALALEPALAALHDLHIPLH
ncbi:hypothetical protein B0H13DRAFT_2361660 [Mycena leptocephala]|nr:hypothetical protein B0H13DRAFT_2361660 [Mycena leptocephala]